MNSSRKVIGLTGGIGSGKSTAARYIASKGLTHIDADAISRNLTEKVPGVDNPVLEEIGRAFESDPDTVGNIDDACAANRISDDAGHRPVILPDGSLDRSAMADLVFHDPVKKQLLEKIMFREIISEIHRQIDAAGEEDSILLDVPLLFESGLDSLCDCVIVLTADHDIRLQRVMSRDGCGAEEVEARIRNQMSDEEKGALADYVVDNSGDMEHLLRQLDEILGSVL